MPRYFFHVDDGEVSPDLHGTELANIDAARTEAVRFAGEQLSGQPERFWDATEWRLRVADARDLTLFQLTVFATDSPSVGRPAAGS